MRRAFGLAGLLALAACTPLALAPLPLASLAPQLVEGQAAVEVASLPGWSAEDHLAAFIAYRQTCSLGARGELAVLCDLAKTLTSPGEAGARAFFEQHFVALPYSGQGLLTGYFFPTYEARGDPDAGFTAPLRSRPPDLVAGQAYAERAEIETRAAPDALAWMRPEDLFFLQIQGSGLLSFPDGRRLKAVYAASNNQPFVAIARPMRQQGLLSAADSSGEAIHAWLAAHAGAAARAVMDLDPRYVFFSLQPDDGAGPIGAAGVPLPPGRAVAIDPGQHAYGELLWLDASAPTLSGAFPHYQRLAMALDTGSAITGQVRADLYLGLGEAAGQEAGRVRHQLTLYRLVRRP